MMKKIILSFAILFATSMSAFAVSSHQADNSKQKTEIKKGKGNKHRGAERAFSTFNQFEGLDLTDEQKAQIMELQKSIDFGKGGKKDKEALAQMTDEQKKEMQEAAQENRQNAMKNYLDGIKNILTPEQYVQFLENSYLNQNDKFSRGVGNRAPMRDFKEKVPMQKDKQ